jgi:hypothetical protein
MYFPRHAYLFHNAAYLFHNADYLFHKATYLFVGQNQRASYLFVGQPLIYLWVSLLFICGSASYLFANTKPSGSRILRKSSIFALFFNTIYL